MGEMKMQLTMEDVAQHVLINGRQYRVFEDRTDKWGRIKPRVEGYYGEVLGWVEVGCKIKIAQVKDALKQTA